MVQNMFRKILRIHHNCFFSVLKFVFFCFYFELLRYRRSSLRGVVAQDSPKDRHEIFDKMQRIFEQSSSRSFSDVFLRFFLRRLPWHSQKRSLTITKRKRENASTKAARWRAQSRACTLRRVHACRTHRDFNIQ